MKLRNTYNQRKISKFWQCVHVLEKCKNRNHSGGDEETNLEHQCILEDTQTPRAWPINGYSAFQRKLNVMHLLCDCAYGMVFIPIVLYAVCVCNWQLLKKYLPYTMHYIVCLICKPDWWMVNWINFHTFVAVVVNHSLQSRFHFCCW